MPFKGTRAFALQHPQQGGEAGEQGQACEIGKEKPQKIPAAPGAVSYTHLTLPTNREV